jgi:serine/threonine protein kinase
LSWWKFIFFTIIKKKVNNNKKNNKKTTKKQQKNRFDEELALKYLCEVVLAIEELHYNNILYRDLKPENVVLC